MADPSDPVTEYAIKRACIEFCASSWIWKYLPDAMDITAGESTYDLEAPPATDISSVMSAEYNGVPLVHRGLDWLNAEIPGWRTTRNTSKYFTQVDTEQIILAAVPQDTITGGLTLTLALQPSQASTGIPKWIANQYLYTLVDGALSKLMLMPGKPWTDQKTGEYHRTRFDAGAAQARTDAVMALARATHRSSSQH